MKRKITPVAFPWSHKKPDITKRLESSLRGKMKNISAPFKARRDLKLKWKMNSENVWTDIHTFSRSTRGGGREGPGGARAWGAGALTGLFCASAIDVDGTWINSITGGGYYKTKTQTKRFMVLFIFIFLVEGCFSRLYSFQRETGKEAWGWEMAIDDDDMWWC